MKSTDPFPCTHVSEGRAGGISGEAPWEARFLSRKLELGLQGFIVHMWLGILTFTKQVDGELKSQEWAASGELCPARGAGNSPQDSCKGASPEVQACSLPRLASLRSVLS